MCEWGPFACPHSLSKSCYICLLEPDYRGSTVCMYGMTNEKMPVSTCMCEWGLFACPHSLSTHAIFASRSRITEVQLYVIVWLMRRWGSNEWDFLWLISQCQSLPQGLGLARSYCMWLVAWLLKYLLCLACSLPLREGSVERVQCAERDGAQWHDKGQERPLLRADPPDHQEVQEQGG